MIQRTQSITASFFSSSSQLLLEPALSMRCDTLHIVISYGRDGFHYQVRMTFLKSIVFLQEY